MVSPAVNNAVSFLNLFDEPAGAFGPYRLGSGKWGYTYLGAGTPSATLQILGGDLATYCNVAAAITTSGTYGTIDIPEGSYQVVFGGSSSANYFVLARIGADN